MALPTLRPATLDDAAELAAVRISAWRAAYKEIVPAAFLAAMDVGQDERRWRERMNRDGREDIVCIVDDAIVGYATFGPSRAGDAGATTGELSAIYLRPDAWGRGYGRALWQAAVDRLHDRGFDAVIAWVLRDNLRARRFYERVGMSVDGERNISIAGTELVEVRYTRIAF